MIYSSIHLDTNLPMYPKAIQTALAYLKNNDFTKFNPGVYEIQGKDLYAQVFDIVTDKQDVKQPESHNQFIDVQFLVSGKEKIGVSNYKSSYIVKEHIIERDLIYYENVEDETLLEMKPGFFCVFYPDDVHRPAVLNCESMEIRKVVIKINIDLLKKN